MRHQRTESIFSGGEGRCMGSAMAKIGERCGASAILPHTHEVGDSFGNALKISVYESRYSTSYVWQVRIEATDADYCSIDAGGGLQEGLVGRGRRCVISATLQNYF